MNLQEAVEIVSQGVGYRLGSQISEDATLDKDIILKTSPKPLKSFKKSLPKASVKLETHS